ncbi:MAG: phosphatidylserine decarboxylase family protein [Prevotellaceae bacterium]|jgi:phosphatidylserine decarboxylase|nr:phosphatidylserine decarboxylase family protein [Prevotellaceae bacterium]
MKIHKEGRGIIVVCAILVILVTGVAAAFFGAGWISGIVAAAALWAFLFVCYFFRSPSRVPVTGDNVVLAAADGKIVIVDEVYEPEYLKARCIQVSVFMSIFNVHANYFPVDGTVAYFRYHPGTYLVAWHPKSSEKNERTTVVVNHNGVPVLFRQIAGLFARRIVCYAKEGTTVQQGGETGFIKFGSRVDIFLPLGTDIKVKEGDKVKATQTVIAKLT